MTRPRLSSDSSIYIRNITFGVEDSLASTVGLLSGVASANAGASAIIITGVILVFTEALSMGVGSFLSEESVEEFKHRPQRHIISAAVLMFISYFISGLLPILPYVLLPVPLALIFSILTSLVGLVILGVFNAYVSHTPLLKHLARMLFLGGSVVIAGLVVGNLLKSLGYAS